ncbi:uncharacterized protein BDZ83DRAFT_657073 [Colletotrichum acutatum]|uniref:Uncharacterized protein n=1 Tax=Glomerella acutata TaxID=27357 RepID=A0AAD8XA75_GLOAC|nr:uncharacterized protein BDZ83DRAFT_657073 [Colletotrichum acutatum]KAK1710341.1 hypothetical protein BDZ83DRAFT_657073 [Colletotrichum acutatum]
MNLWVGVPGGSSRLHNDARPPSTRRTQFQYPSHSNKLKPEAQQTTVRKVKSRAQQVPNCTRSNCPGEPSPLIPPKLQSPASSPESGYLLVCPFFSVRSCMEYIPLRRGVTPAAQTPEHAERSGCPSPSSPRAIALQCFHRENLPEATEHGSQQVDVEGLNLEGWLWLGIPPPLRIRFAAVAVFACLQLHLPCITIHRSPPPPPPPTSCSPHVPIPYPMCQMAQYLFDRL